MKSISFTNKKHVLFIIVLALITVASVILIIPTNMQVDASGFSLSAEIDPSTLVLGNTIDVPKGKFDGKKAQLNVVCPDGTTYNNPKTLTFTQAGRYELLYTCKGKGGYLIEKQNLMVVNQQFSTSDGKQKFSYGKLEQTGREGLNVTLSKGTSFHVNKAINMWETSMEDPALTYTVPVNNENAFDAEIMMIRFTDVYDSDNYFEMKIETQDKIWNALYAAAVGRAFGGYDNSNTGAFSTAYGSFYNMYSSNNYAEPTWASNDLLKNQHLSIWYDETENAVYMSFYHFKLQEVYSTKVCDFDNIEEQSSPWVGFTTGEVFVSIEYQGYKSESAQLQILAMHDVDLKETNFDDGHKTQITVKTDVSQLPVGKVGYYYPIPGATAVNPYRGGQIDYTTRVFYQYPRKDGMYQDISSKYAYECDINDGYFKTDIAGTYAICYRATDHYGEISELVVNITVDDKVSHLGELILHDKVTSGEIGNMIYLANHERPQGGIAPYSTTVKVSKNGVSETVYGNEIDGKYFLPQSKGEYKVTVTVYDYIRNSTSKSYKIKIKEPTAPSFVSEAKLPRYLIADTEYVLPTLMMKDYRDGSEVPAKITITDGNGKTNYKSGDKYVFIPDEEGNAVIKYHFGSNEKNYSIPVVDVIDENEDIDLTQFFVNEDVKVETAASGIVLTATADGSSSFIRDISTTDLTAEMVVNGLGKQFGSFTVRLVDSLDSSISAELQFASDGTYCYKYANGILLSKEILADAVIADISYDYQTNEVSMGGTYGTLTEADGSMFGGFTSGRIYMDFCIEDVTGNSEVVIKSIKNQKMNIDILSDRIKPDIYAEHDYGVVIHKVGDVIKLYDVVADDVLSGYVHMTLTVTKGEEVVTSDNGLSLREVTPQVDSFTISDTETYSLKYTASDWYGNENTYLVRFYVVEKNAPTIKVSSWKNKFEIGKINLPTVSVKDDVTKEPVVYMTIFGPNGEIYKISGNTFTAKLKGQYVLRITAFDEVGNTSVVEKEFTIK